MESSGQDFSLKIIIIIIIIPNNNNNNNNNSNNKQNLKKINIKMFLNIQRIIFFKIDLNYLTENFREKLRKFQ